MQAAPKRDIKKALSGFFALLQASADNPLLSIYYFFTLNVNKQISRGVTIIASITNEGNFYFFGRPKKERLVEAVAFAKSSNGICLNSARNLAV